MEKLFSIKMGKAVCAVDLGDGSERGEYVSQDYILSKLGRPHRSISLMYCYYPFDKQWPARIADINLPRISHPSSDMMTTKPWKHSSRVR